MRFALLLLATGCRIAFDTTDRSGVDAPSEDAAEPDSMLAAISAVQFTPLLSVDAVNPFVVTFPAPTTSGNAIGVLVWSWAPGSTAYPSNGVTDGLGNNYSQLQLYTSAIGTCAGGTGGAAIYLAPAIAGQANHAISLAIGGDSQQQVAMVAVEYRGLSANPFLQATSNVSNAASPLTIGTGTIPISQSDTLIVSVATLCGGYPDLVSWSNATGAITRGVQPETFFRAPGIAGDRVVGAGTAEELWTAAFSGAPPVDGIGVIAAVR